MFVTELSESRSFGNYSERLRIAPLQVSDTMKRDYLGHLGASRPANVLVTVTKTPIRGIIIMHKCTMNVERR